MEKNPKVKKTDEIPPYKKGVRPVKFNAGNPNEAKLRGYLVSAFKEHHSTNDGNVIFESYILIGNPRNAAKYKIPLQIEKSALEKIKPELKSGDFIEVEGPMHSKNIYDEHGNKMQRRCYILVKNLNRSDENQFQTENKVCIYGTLGKKGNVFRKYSGDDMLDFMLNVYRSRDRRAAIPCIVWGSTLTTLFDVLPESIPLKIVGWLKERTFKTSMGIEKTVIEVNVEDFEFVVGE